MTNNQDINVSLPQSDVRLLRGIAKRMGWVVKVPRRKNALDRALEEIERGECTDYSSVDDFARKVLGADGI